MTVDKALRKSRRSGEPLCLTAHFKGETWEKRFVMPIAHTRRSDSPLVVRVTEVVYDRPARDVTVPDGCWDLVVMKRRSETFVLQTGLITAPVPLEFDEGDRYLCISLKPSAFVPTHPGAVTIDKGIPRPLTTARTFWFENERFEVPRFENAESLIERLVRAQHVCVDELVDGVLQGRPKAATLRTLQRRFQRVTGLTWKRLEMIQRANAAREELLRGTDASEVAAQLGFSDQAHLIRSIRQFFGQTPKQLAATGAA